MGDDQSMTTNNIDAPYIVNKSRRTSRNRHGKYHSDGNGNGSMLKPKISTSSSNQSNHSSIIHRKDKKYQILIVNHHKFGDIHHRHSHCIKIKTKKRIKIKSIQHQ